MLSSDSGSSNVLLQTVKLSCSYLLKKEGTNHILTQGRRWPPILLTQVSVKKTGRARQESCGWLNWRGRLQAHQHRGIAVLTAHRKRDSLMSSPTFQLLRQFSTKPPSIQRHYAVTEVPCLGSECDASPSQ